MENYGICEKCGYPLKFRERPDTIHHGEIYCPKCGKHVRWVPKPDKKSSGRKTTSRYDVVAVAKHHGFEKPFCFFCGRTQEQLGTNEINSRFIYYLLVKGVLTLSTTYKSCAPLAIS